MRRHKCRLTKLHGLQMCDELVAQVASGDGRGLKPWCYPDGDALKYGGVYLMLTKMNRVPFSHCPFCGGEFRGMHGG